VFQPLVDRAPQRLAHRLAARGQKADAVVMVAESSALVQRTHLGCRVSSVVRLHSPALQVAPDFAAHIETNVVLECPRRYIPTDRRPRKKRNP
jgi:hypothetical protein